MPPAKLVEFANGGGRVVVEIEDQLAGPLPASAGSVAGKATESFEEAVAGIRPIAEAVLAQVRELGPAEATVEFGIKFTAKAGVVLAAASTEGHCKISLKWTKPGA